MELLAQGRDCDIYDCGDGTVLRRSRQAYDQTHEARVLQYAAEHGYPVPKVHELVEDGRDLIMEKVAGPTMVEAIQRRPWQAGAIGRQLARPPHPAPRDPGTGLAARPARRRHPAPLRPAPDERDPGPRPGRW